MPPASDPRAQIETVLRVLEGRSYPRESPIFAQTVKWMTYVATTLKDGPLVERLIDAAERSFNVPRTELYMQIGGIRLVPAEGAVKVKLVNGTDAILRDILPKGGWFEWYDEYTQQTESPLSYHIFASMGVLGSALGRKVYMDMGFFKIFPNWCCVLIGPTGRVKKTSATDIAKGFIKAQAICPIMADAITPEALATALSRDGGHQLVYAPEFAVLFNRQKYNETLTTRIIRLLDCPDTFEVETVGRGKEEIHNVTLTFLGCSTPSLFTGATPEMVTSSGFLNRFLLVMEEDTDREFPVPAKGERRLEIKLEQTISYAKKLEGRMDFTPEAFQIYKQWYSERKKFVRTITDEIHAEAIERGSSHLIRTAMITHVAQCGTDTICQPCMEAAVKLLQFVERGVPSMVHSIRKTQRDEESERILIVLRRSGNLLSHSDLLRKSRLDAATFKRAMGTLIERREVEEKKQGSIHLYILNEEVKDA